MSARAALRAWLARLQARGPAMRASIATLHARAASAAKVGLAPFRAQLVERAPRLALRLLDVDDRELGLAGESIAARELADAGFVIVGRRLRERRNEIDLLAREHGSLVAIEVKTGRTFAVPAPRGTGAHVSLRWRPLLRVDARKRERLEHAARRLAGARARVDVVEVLVDTRTRRIRVIHHRGEATRDRGARGRDSLDP